MSKDVIILRSVSGAGKTTIASVIGGREGWVVCCADDYFETPEGYNFKVEELGLAHAKCQSNFLSALHNDSIAGIVVANTNTKPRDFRFYEEKAKDIGARVFFLVVENRHGGKDVHNVPEAALLNQEDNIRNNLKLR